MKEVAQPVKQHLDGLEVLSVAEASARADWIMILLPDEFQKDVYSKEIAPHLKPERYLALLMVSIFALN